jgi:AAA domain
MSNPSYVRPSPEAANGEEEPPNPWVKHLEDSLASSAQLRKLQIKPREPILADWFKEGDLGFIFAPRGVGKTWLAIDIARGIAEGRSVGPWKDHGSKNVLYIDGEMPPDSVKERDQGLGSPCDNLVYINHEILFQRTGRILNLTDFQLQKAILEICLDLGIKVVFLDNISTLVSGSDENKGLDWEMIQPWLLDLRRRKIAVVFIHHAGRNPKEMRGHSKREDSAFWVIRLERTEELEARIGAKFISRFTKTRNTADEPSAYEWCYTPFGDRTQVTCREMSSIDVFKRVVQDGLCSATDIAAEMSMSKGYVSKLAKKAERAGWLTIDRGIYKIAKPEATDSHD